MIILLQCRESSVLHYLLLILIQSLLGCFCAKALNVPVMNLSFFVNFPVLLNVDPRKTVSLLAYGDIILVIKLV